MLSYCIGIITGSMSSSGKLILGRMSLNVVLIGILSHNLSLLHVHIDVRITYQQTLIAATIYFSNICGRNHIDTRITAHFDGCLCISVKCFILRFCSCNARIISINRVSSLVSTSIHTIFNNNRRTACLTNVDGDRSINSSCSVITTIDGIVGTVGDIQGHTTLQVSIIRSTIYSTTFFNAVERYINLSIDVGTLTAAIGFVSNQRTGT